MKIILILVLIFQIYRSNNCSSVSDVISIAKISKKTLTNGVDVNIFSRLNIRGGKSIDVKRSIDVKKSKKNKKQGVLASIKDQLNKVYPATRVYLLLSLFCTIVHMIGLPAQALFSLDITKLFEVWRPFTSVAYLGSPSMSMANSLYFLIRYGQSLESQFGTGSHTWFLLIEIIILSMLGYLLGFPYLAQSMISATVYVSANLNPFDRMPFQFGLMIASWQLPYCLMIIDILSQQSAGAAWPHVLGIFAGHFYHFFTNIWPKLGGKDWLKTPNWLIKKLGDNPNAVVSVNNKSKNAKPKKIPRGLKGKKLGSPK